jgi:hypothetical protein
MTFMGAREMQQAAKRYLDKVSGNEALLARVEALEAENRRLAAEALDPLAAADPDLDAAAVVDIERARPGNKPRK